VARVQVFVKLKPSLLDSAGRTVEQSLNGLGFGEVSDVRIGKLIELTVEPFSAERVKSMCDRLLANPVIENYEIREITE
jgi:phosphoribosylformylglycinamidine synthase